MKDGMSMTCMCEECNGVVTALCGAHMARLRMDTMANQATIERLRDDNTRLREGLLEISKAGGLPGMCARMLLDECER